MHMQLVTDSEKSPPAAGANFAEVSAVTSQSAYPEYRIIRRNGGVVGFNPRKISVAMTKAFLAIEGGQGAASARIRELVAGLTEGVVTALARRQPGGGTFHIEDIQDQVELALMRSGEHEVARAYVLYREQRAKARTQELAKQKEKAAAPELHVIENGVRRPINKVGLKSLLKACCEGLGEAVDPAIIFNETLKNLYDGVPIEEIRKSAILSARALIEKDPAYSFVTARLLLNTIRIEILGEEVPQAQMAKRYAEYFPDFIKRGIAAELLDERLAKFDLARLGSR
jgi:ribonucleoside-diphosphate reductase alpha chain